MNKIKYIICILTVLSLFIVSACDIIDVVQGAKKIKRYSDARKIEFSEADGYYIGRKILGNFFIKNRPLFDKKLTEYVNSIGQTLAAVSERPDIWAGYRFIVYRSAGIGGYSIPGGFILISTGLLRLCDNEDQLAAVLGHELGHSRYRHALAALKKVMVKKARQDLAVFLANRSGSNLAKIFTIAALINWERQMNKYSRTQELEADVYSCWMMMKCGYNPMHMIKILRKIPNGRSQYCRLHPTVSKRIREVKKEIARYKKIPTSSKKRTLRYKKNVLDYLKYKSWDSMEYNENKNTKDKDDDDDSDSKDEDENEENE